jgi:2-methylcitrate dehydratase
MKDLAYKLAKYSYNLKFQDLSYKTIHEAKRRIIDSLGCGINVFEEKSVNAIRKICKNIKSFYSSTLIGTKIKTSPEWAAFCNGYAIRYLDWNDTYLSKEPAHPSDNIAGTFAICEAEDCGGKDLILSTVLAYEIQCRLCDAASLRAKGWDHVNYILVSSSLAASKLMGLSVKEMRQAVNIALNNLSTRQNRVGELSNWKAAAAANAVRNGIFAAMLAKEGFTGPDEIFEGKYGFQNQVSGNFELDLSLFGKKGKSFMIEETYIKKYNAEYHAQSAVDAALKLRQNIKNIKDIESVIIETHEAGFTIIGNKEKEPQKWNPKTKETADHSLPYITTIALIDGEVTEKQYKKEKFRDRKILEFLKSVEVVENPKFTEAYPKNGIINKVIVKMRDGRIFSEQVNFPKGHPKNPMSDEEVEDKFIHLTSRYFEEKQIKDILKFLWNIENTKSIKELFPLIFIR